MRAAKRSVPAVRLLLACAAVVAALAYPIPVHATAASDASRSLWSRSGRLHSFKQSRREVLASGRQSNTLVHVPSAAAAKAMEFLDPPTPPTAGDVWRATLRAFWDHGGSAASFCLGGRRGDPTPMLALLRKSFTLGPVDRTLGAVCGNDSVVQVHLCTAPEITQYYEYILRTDNPEKVPDLATCRAGSASPACGPGFFDAAPADSRPARRQRSSSHGALQSLWPQGGGQLPPAEVDSADRADGQLNVASQPHACCDGFFCPAALTCMMPCPLGAICSRAVPADPPDAWLESAPGDVHRRNKK